MQAHNETEAYRESNRAAARFVVWTVAWLVTLAVARFGPEVLWDPQQTLASWLAVGVNFVAGIGWIVAFTGLLRAMDELQRKIVQDALAVTLGIGWVLGFAYVVADNAGLVASDINLAVFPALLGVIYLLAFAVGKFRYR